MTRTTTMSEDKKALEVSTTPAVTGASPVQPNAPAIVLPPQVALVQAPGLIDPAKLVGKGPFVGKYVVFTPVGNQLTQPMDTAQADTFAKKLLAEKKACVIMLVVSQHTP